MFHDEPLRVADTQRLYENFYGIFDKSKIDDFLRQFHKKGKKVCLGEGRHFQAFHLPTAWGHAGMDLVVSVARRGERGSPASELYEQRRLGRWQRDMQKLAALRIPLIPPFAMVQAFDLLALVTPFGQAQFAELQAHWQPLPLRLEQFQHKLRQNGFVLEDSLQLRLWQGIPFICDLSDLKSL